MTRLFDALRKARSADAPIPPAPVPVTPALPSAEARVTRPVLELPVVPKDQVRRSVRPFGRVARLPLDVTREMSTLRVRLEAMLTERIPRIVLFLASQGGEGTSTVTAQFAQALAADPRLRVLLVDLHTRRPAYAEDGSSRLDGADLPAPPGRGGASVTPNLDLMPVPEAVATAGGAAPQVLQNMLQALAGGYDWILLDGPPVLESPDAAPLGQAADGVVVVVEAGRTKRPVLARSVDLMSRSGGRVIGIVLNRRRLEIPEFIYRRI
jgi:Mrp family chromosome partitioning ATPase